MDGQSATLAPSYALPETQVIRTEKHKYREGLMKVLITGGAGFIGSALARAFIRDGDDQILVLDKLTYAGNLASLQPIAGNPRFSFLQADICDRAAVSCALSEFQPDVVMHLAAESHVDRSIDGPAPFIETNLVGTFVLLEAALEYWRALPASGPREVSASSTSPPTRSSVRSAPRGSSARTRPIRRTRPTPPQGRSGPPRARLGTHLRVANDRHQLLQQLRSLPLSREAHPADDHQRARGPAAARLWPGENVRDWLYVEDHAAALMLVAREGVIGRILQRRRAQ